MRRCIKCNRPLTDALSIRLGIGPVCRGGVGKSAPTPTMGGLFGHTPPPVDITAKVLPHKQVTAVLIVQHEPKNPTPEYLERATEAARTHTKEINVPDCLIIFRSYNGYFYLVGKDNKTINLETKNQSNALNKAILRS